QRFKLASPARHGRPPATLRSNKRYRQVQAMEFESVVRSPLAKLLRGSLAVALLAMGALVACPCFGQDAPAEATPAAPAAAGGAAAPAAGADAIASGNLVNVGIVVALFIGSILIGAFLAKQLRMPDHGWKF